MYGYNFARNIKVMPGAYCAVFGCGSWRKTKGTGIWKLPVAIVYESRQSSKRETIGVPRTCHVIPTVQTQTHFQRWRMQEMTYSCWAMILRQF